MKFSSLLSKLSIDITINKVVVIAIALVILWAFIGPLFSMPIGMNSKIGSAVVIIFFITAGLYIGNYIGDKMNKRNK